MLDFLVPVVGVEIAFGGDFSDPFTDVFPAHLIGYAGGEVVAEAMLTADRYEAIDQTISITSAVRLDRAIFGFVQLGEYQPLGPLVDNIRLGTVPEPALGLILLGAAAARAHRPSRC